MRPQLLPEITDEASGKRYLPKPLPPAVYLPSQELASEKGSDQRRKGKELPSESAQYAQGDREKDRQMNCEKPLQRVLADVGSPVSERQIENNKCDRYNSNMHGALVYHISWSLARPRHKLI